MRRKLAALGVALAVVALTSGAVFAASKVIPNDGVFYACYDAGGNVKFIDYSATQTCPKSWTGPVTWNQSGLIGIHNVYNIGNDDPVELMELIATLERELGQVAVKDMLPIQPGDVPATWANVDDLTRDVGFKPATPIAEGVRRFVKWYREYYKVET